MSSTRFLYHAYAAGLAGKIHRPFEETLEVKAPSALPPSGGISETSARDVRIRDMLYCGSVTSRSTGIFHAASGTFETRATSTAEKFDLGNGVLTADLVRATVHSSYRDDDNRAPLIVPDGSAIINLKVNGTPIELEPLADLFTELNTLDKIRDRHRNDEEFRTKIHEYSMVGRHEELAKDRLHRYFPFCHRTPGMELHETKHAAILPLFKVLTTSGPGFRAIQNVIYIENFGRVQLGELIVLPYERRVTGIHVDLGSPVGGDVDCSSVGANGGRTDPP